MRIIYFMIGLMSLGLGAIGVILPILPTTPFLLLAAFCFAKSSKKVHDWFLTTSLYQNHLDAFVKERAMTLKTKASILGLASFMLAFPLIFSQNIYLRMMIVCLYIFKYYYFIFRIQTIPEKRTDLR